MGVSMTERVSTGQKLQASPLRKANVINDVLDAKDDYKRRQRGEAREPIRGVTPTDLVKVRNDSGSDLLIGNVLQLGGYLLDSINKRHLWFQGDTPDGPERFAIIGEPVAYGKLGTAHVSGACVARVDVTNVAHKRAKVEASSNVLISDDNGPVLFLSSISTTGEQEVIVLIDYQASPDEGRHFGVELLEDVGNTEIGEVDAKIMEMDFVTEVESSATVFDNGGIFEGGVEGSKGIAVKVDGEYHLIQLSCPPPEEE
jgi:hypothetical protein